VNTIKAFVGAGIANRIVALFDNDTATRAALRALDRISLPKSLRIVLLPKVPIAASYPNIGPSGSVHMNGMALPGA
jgi:hypothetical protein